MCKNCKNCKNCLLWDCLYDRCRETKETVTPEHSCDSWKENKYISVSEVERRNKRIGRYWFSKSTMAFFNTKIESGIINDYYFITSESPGDGHPRKFCIRKANPDGTVDTVGDHHRWSTYQACINELKRVLGVSVLTVQ